MKNNVKTNREMNVGGNFVYFFLNTGLINKNTVPVPVLPKMPQNIRPTFYDRASSLRGALKMTDQIAQQNRWISI